MNKFARLGAQASLIVFASASLFSCGSAEDPGLEYAPDMYHSIPLDPYSQIDANYAKYNPYGMNMRMTVPGTVPRGKMGYTMNITKDSAEVAGRELNNPFATTEQHLEEGKVLYTRFCAHCHGETGEGDGLVGQKFKGVPSYSAGRVANLSAGHIFHVITKGRGRMMPHGSLIDPDERWKIVMYVQTLQGGEQAVPVDSTVTGASKENLQNVAAGEASRTPYGNVNVVTGYMMDGTLRNNLH